MSTYRHPERIAADPDGSTSHRNERTFVCKDAPVESEAGAPITVTGGYDFEPAGLGGQPGVTGVVAKWIQRDHTEPACVVLLDEPLTAEGLVDGKREIRTGQFLVLTLRYAGQTWQRTGTVHVELREAEQLDEHEHQPGAWVESHATYDFP